MRQQGQSAGPVGTAQSVQHGSVRDTSGTQQGSAPARHQARLVDTKTTAVAARSMI